METKKLTIEHLAPYLPYGIRMINTKSGRIIDVRGLRATVSTFIIEATVKSDNGINDVEYQSDLWRLKPILRPLSDLFNDNLNPIPVNELKSKYGWDYLFYNVYKKKEPFNVNALSYACLVKLFEWHFDVFSLIDAGLAIDINSIKP